MIAYPPEPPAPMDETQQERYSRHMLLPQIGRAGQERLLASRVAVVGLGGLGSPVAMYLASAGVGRLALLDFDVVQLSNLQRQIIHDTAALGREKTESARERVYALNPDVAVETFAQLLDDEELREALAGADVVVDGSDNFETRFAVNAACVASGTPLVSGAAIRWEGQVAVFEPRCPASPCYRCLYADTGEEAEACGEVGVFAPLLGIIGSVQAAETLKVLLGVETTLTGRLLLVDALGTEWRTLTVPRDPDCPVCGR